MRPDDELELEDGNERVPDIIPTATKHKQLKKGEKPLSEVTDIKCPDCTCDYIIPCIKMSFIRSFAGNRLQCHWPEREASNDTALVSCPNCGLVFRITPSGSIQKTERRLAKKSKKN